MATHAQQPTVLLAGAPVHAVRRNLVAARALARRRLVHPGARVGQVPSDARPGLRMPSTVLAPARSRRRHIASRYSHRCSNARIVGGMTLALQPSLFDSPDPPTPRRSARSAGHVRPHSVSAHGAWVDHLPGLAGAARTSSSPSCVDRCPGRPSAARCTTGSSTCPGCCRFYGEHDPLPHPLLDEARAAARATTTSPSSASRSGPAGCASTATAGTASPGTATGSAGAAPTDTMVAILSLGEARQLMLRPNGGGAGRTLGFTLGHGDLLVMGGSCQRTWEHGVPKSRTPLRPADQRPVPPPRRRSEAAGFPAVMSVQLVAPHGSQPVGSDQFTVGSGDAAGRATVTSCHVVRGQAAGRGRRTARLTCGTDSTGTGSSCCPWQNGALPTGCDAVGSDSSPTSPW